MIRLRVSTLESYRRIVATEWGDEAALIETLKRGQWVDGPASWQMQAGTAWHHVLAGQPNGRLGDMVYTFDPLAIQKAKEYAGPGLCEVTGRRVFDAFGCPVEVEGTADHVHGLVIQDHKAKFSTPDARDYEASLQWRFYLLIHGAACFRYNLFDFADPKDGYCELRNVVSFRFWPYVGMEQDCRRWLGEFLDWAHAHRLTQYLLPGRRAA